MDKKSCGLYPYMFLQDDSIAFNMILTYVGSKKLDIKTVNVSADDELYTFTCDDEYGGGYEQDLGCWLDMELFQLSDEEVSLLSEWLNAKSVTAVFVGRDGTTQSYALTKENRAAIQEMVTAYNLMLKHGYPHKFYYINFDTPARSYRFNPLKAVQDAAELMQLMEDMLRAFLPPKSEENEWFTGALGILRAVAFRLWDEYRRYCTIPHIVLLIMDASLEELQSFLQRNSLSSMMAGAYLKAAGSEKTQASYISTLCNYLSTFAADKNLAYVLSGDEFDYNLIDPENPKMFDVSNN